MLKTTFSLVILFTICNQVTAQNFSKLKILYRQNKEITIVVDSALHHNYGFAYPMTYSFTLPPNSSQLTTYKKYNKNEDWTNVQEKTSNDFFNGIEAVRYDYSNNRAYVSVAFGPSSDSILIRVTNFTGNNIPIEYSEICKYYDNRDAVVTATADDWNKYTIDDFSQAIYMFRTRNLWISCGVITDSLDSTDQSTWEKIQSQLDSGYVEVLSHSRTHSYLPYNYNSEIIGSKNDIIEKLNLPSLFRKNQNEYIYAYINPYGEFNDSVDYVAGTANYLVTRGTWTGFYDYTLWNNDKNIYERANSVYELGNSGGEMNLTILNNNFDYALQNHKVYHFYFHPWDMSGLWTIFSDHLDYISNKKNVWYTAFGHLYLYHFLEDGSYTPTNSFIYLSSKIFLEGPYNSTSDQMDTFINDSIPTTSPYPKDARTVSMIPTDVVDWVLVELRTTDSGSAVISKSVFLNRDGYLVSDDGNTQNVLLGVVPGSYYVVIKHRNHLAVMSANVVLTVNDSLTYDFTSDGSQFYGGSDGAKEVKNGIWGMITGDGDGNGQIQNNDSEEIWKLENGTSGYKNGDYNMNGQVQNDDNEKYWKTNNGRGSWVAN